MKTAKSYKIITLLIAFVMAILASFALMQGATANAQTTSIDPTEFFRISNSDVSFDAENNNIYFEANDSKVFKTVNKLVFNDFAMNIDVSLKVKVAKFKIESTSYASSVDKNASSTIVNELKVNYENDRISLNNGNEEYVSGLNNDSLIAFNAQDGLISATIEGVTVTEDRYDYKIAGNDKAVGYLVIEFELYDEEDPAIIKIFYIDQGASISTHDYRQDFVKTNNKFNLAKPRADISSGAVVHGQNLNVIDGKQYDLTINTYSVIGDNSTAYLVCENAWIENTKNPNSIAFNQDSESFAIANADFSDGVETYMVNIMGEDIEAPTYNMEEKVIEALNNQLVNVYKENIGEEDEHYVRLGKSITIPSDYFKGMVSDNLYLFSDLTHTMYYKTPTSESGSTSGWSITLSAAGDYEFYVVFKDPAGNTMEKDQFYTVDGDEVITEGCEYSGYVFRFHIEDDADMSVEAPESIPEWYVGVEYKGSNFVIESSGYTPTYTLKYNSDVNATETSDGWITIPKASLVAESYNENGYTYSDIKSIAYDGEVTFTPNAKGAYMITCAVNSTQSVKTSSETIIVKVDKEITTVKPDNHWLQNNVWSVVFLGVGTLCLIGIIILLFIKPKTKVEDDE